MEKVEHDSNLSKEYSNLYPLMLKLEHYMEAKVKYVLKDLIFNLKEYEKIEISARVKECKSAIQTLRTKNPFGWDPDKKYSLTTLKDLVGIRISVFPMNLLSQVQEKISSNFKDWTKDDEHKHLKVFKYQGKVKKRKINCEIQIAPILLSAYWQIEHDTLYKTHPELLGIEKNQKIQAINDEILNKLIEFEEEFEKFISSKD